MSKNFLRVKRKLVEEMEGTANHTQESWAQIMLRAAERCITDEDQKDFYRFVLNPSDAWDVTEPTFVSVVPTPNVLIKSFDTINVSSDEDEKECTVTLKNNVHTEGKIAYIHVTQEE